jgi:GTP-binding protein HflX
VQKEQAENSQLVMDIPKSMDNRVYICAKEKDSLEELICVMEKVLSEGAREYTLLLPYSQGAVVNDLTVAGAVLNSEYLPDGIKIIAKLSPRDYERYSEYEI